MLKLMFKSLQITNIFISREEYIYDEVEVKEQEIILNLEDDNIANVATVSLYNNI